VRTQFRPRAVYPGPVYNPIGGEELGEPHTRDRHLEMWADALFGPLLVPSARGGWATEEVLNWDEAGLRTCKECRGAVFVEKEYDEGPLSGHRAWHDRLYETMCIVAKTSHIHGKGE